VRSVQRIFNKAARKNRYGEDSVSNVFSLAKLAKLVRYYILESTTSAGSGHPTSSLSAVELMTCLMFNGYFRYDANNPQYENNDRIIFSKGHASPLLYALWAVAGKVSEKELLSLRHFGSRLEGHPSLDFPYAEAPTGSLGQGLSIGVGKALNAKYLDKLPYRVFVLLGDSEMSEGSVWEAVQIAAHYKLDNLIGIIDVNRLGQRGETMWGHNVSRFERVLAAFGWHTIVVDGHRIEEVCLAYEKALRLKGKPVMIIAKTIKGKGVSFLEDKEGWHGKVLNKDEFIRALVELGGIDKSVVGHIRVPEKKKPKQARARKVKPILYKRGDMVATRKAYGTSLGEIFFRYPDIVCLDAEVSNSTYAKDFAKCYPERFFEMFIAEQNMVGTALGLSLRGKIPFVSTFAAFLARAHDQIRMSEYARANIKFVGSHAGVSIGQDGPSQMGLGDIAMFRSILGSVVLYPCDAVSMRALVERAAQHKGIAYLRTTRMDTPVLYTKQDAFHVGGSKILKESSKDKATIIAAGITVHEALGAYEALKAEGIIVRVIDAYSIKPLDVPTIVRAAKETKALITVEDHFLEGGLGDAIDSALSDMHAFANMHRLAVTKIPESGAPRMLLDYEGISKQSIINAVKKAI